LPAAERFTQAQVIAALKATKGMITVAARHLQCSPTTVENYINRYEAVREARRLEREAFLDVGELALMKAVQGGEAWAVCFLLKTQGKSRGYVERTEVTGADGRAIEVEDVTRLSDEERAKRVGRLLDLAAARQRKLAEKKQQSANGTAS
jgi:hypothetical protein